MTDCHRWLIMKPLNTGWVHPINESVHFAYILEKAETARKMWRSFCPQRTGEIRPAPVLPESAGILSVLNKNGSL
jgi:hypothetical protein